MKSHAKKLAAPIIITCITAAIIIAYFSVFLFVEGMPLVVRIIAGIICFSVLGVDIYVLVERIREIKGGEEDDLSKY